MARADGIRSGQSREAFWRRVLNEQKRSGLNQTAFCRSKSLSPPTYFWWKREIAARDAKRMSSAKVCRGREERGAPRALIPVRVVERPATYSAPFEIVLRDQKLLRVPQDFDAEGLRRLVLALEQC